MSTARHDIRIDATIDFVEAQSDPAADRYVFAYTITIANHGAVTAQLIDRHWIITDASGKVQEVRGEGVVGEQPVLAPGESFRYTSAAMIETPVGSMHGSYGMVDADGARFEATIAPFSLSRPRQLH